MPMFKPNDPIFDIINSNKQPLVDYREKKAGIRLGLTNFDEKFRKAKNNPVVINDIVISKTEDRQRLNDMIFTTYDDPEHLAIQATCLCEKHKGDYNVGNGKRCDVCGELVMYLKDRRLESKLWIRAPEGVAALMSPAVYGMLCDGLVRRRMRIFEWAINASFRMKHCEHIDRIKKRFPDFKRGINWVYHNFDAFIDFLIAARVPMQPQKAREIAAFVKENRHLIFFQHIPIPSSQVFVRERGGDKIYSDTSISEAIEAIRTISSITNPIAPINNEEVQRKSITAIKQLQTYYYTFQGVPLTHKKGLARKHLYGSRLWFTARGVITSQHWTHRHDELRFPWGLFISLMRLHIASILLSERGMDAMEASRWINTAMTTYSVDAHEIVKRLINVSNGYRSGVRVHFQRNPTLHRLSIQAFYVTDVWLDPEINTIAISPMVLAGPNADFDGDQMNVTYALDDYSWEHFERHAPYTGMLDNNRPFSVSSINNLPVPALELAGNWIESERQGIEAGRY